MANLKSEVIITANAKQAAEVMKALKKQTDDLRRTLKQLKTEGKDNTKQYDDLLKRYQALTTAVKQNYTAQEKIDKVMKNLSGSTLRQLKSALSDCKKEMMKMSADNPGLPKLRSQMAAIEGQIRKVTGAASGMQKMFKSVAAYFSAFMVIQQIYGKLKQVVTLNLKYSDQLADIRKVSGLAMEDVDKLSRQLQKIDTRTSQEQLNQLAYAGSRLGMGKYGVEGLAAFTRAADQVNVALHEDLGEEALTQLSKMTEVMGLIPKMGVEKALLATGSAIFKLASTSTSNGEHIVQFAERLTGLAKASGITTDQLLALGSASDAMMLMPEVASTAFSKLITAMQTNHNLIEKNLNIPDGTISNLYSTGRAMDAIVLILEKMHEKGNMNAINDIFKDLGSDGARLKNVMVTMSQNLGMLREHLKTSSTAFREGTAVTHEYEIQQNTANAILERANNLWVKAFVNPEGRDNVKGMAQAWYDTSKALTQSKTYMLSVQLALQSIIFVAKMLITVLPTLIGYLMFRGAYAAIMMVVTGVNAMRASTEGMTAAQLKLNAAQKANVWMAIAAVAIQAGVAICNACQKTEQMTEETYNLEGSMQKACAQFERESRVLGDLRMRIDTATKGTKERNAAIAEFNKKYGSYLDNLLTEASTAKDVARAYERVNKALKQKVFLEARDSAIEESLKPKTEKLVKTGSDANKEIGKEFDPKTYDVKWLKEKAQAAYKWSRENPNETGVAARAADMMTDQMLKETYNVSGKGHYINTAKTKWDSEGSAGIIDVTRVGSYIRNYIEQYFANEDERERINQEYEPYLEDNLGELTNEKPDKAAEKAAKAAERERKKKEREEKLARDKELRLQLADANSEASTLQTDIKNFYEQQIADIYESANASGMSEELTKGMVQSMKSRMAAALTSAREALVGLEDKDAQTFQQKWQDFLSGMSTDVVDKANEQNELLLAQLQQFKPEKYKTAIANIAKQLNKPEGTIISSTWEKATRTTMNDARSQNQQAHLDKEALLKNSHTLKTDADTENKFDQLGFTAPSADQTATLLAGGNDAKAIVQKRHAAYEQLFAYVRSNIVSLYNLTNEAQGDANSILDAIFGKDTDTKNAVVAALPGLTQQVGDDARAMYASLLRYEEEYNTARRKEVEEQKKNLEALWEHNDNNPENPKSSKHTEYKTTEAQGKAYDMFESAGFDLKASADPEIELYRMKMEAAQAYYDFLAAHGADAQIMADQEQALTDARAEYEERMLEVQEEKFDRLREYGDALEEAGSTLGEALGDEEQSVKEACGEIINSFMKVTMNMIKEYTTQSIQTALFNKKKKKLVTQGAAEQQKLETKSQDAVTDIVKQGEDVKMDVTQTAQEGTTRILQQQGAQQLSTQMQQTTESVQTTSSETQATTTMGIASGASKIIAKLGWWGIPLIAVITALLNGLLSFAMSKVTSLFGGGSSDSSTDSGSTIKLAQGMLTYDAGNVQAFSGVEDGKTYPVVGNDGKVYAAKTAKELMTGLVTDPVAALINGEPALVAEKGPEMIIGRETTAAMQMDRPDLLREIVDYDRRHSRGQGYHTYDAGNVQDFTVAGAEGGSNFTAADVQQMRDALAQSHAVNSALLKEIQKGIKVNMWGRGGLYESTKTANQFAKQVGLQ